MRCNVCKGKLRVRNERERKTKKNLISKSLWPHRSLKMKSSLDHISIDETEMYETCSIDDDCGNFMF